GGTFPRVGSFGRLLLRGRVALPSVRAPGAVAGARREPRPGPVMAMIRMARGAHPRAILAIYPPFCATTAVSFELEPPSEDEIASRIRAVTAYCPWLILEDEGGGTG